MSQRIQVSGAGISSPAAETAILTAGPFSSSIPGQQVKVSGVLNVTAGTSTTAIVLRCRQGQNSTTGNIVDGPASETHTLAAGASASIPFDFKDATGVPNQAGGTYYTVTVAQIANTVAGTVNYGTLNVEPD